MSALLRVRTYDPNFVIHGRESSTAPIGLLLPWESLRHPWWTPGCSGYFGLELNPACPSQGLVTTPTVPGVIL